MTTKFLGIGTGRCGTKSLMAVINSCQNCKATHEAFLTPWESVDIKELLNWFTAHEKYNLIALGDISLNNLPKIVPLRKKIPNLKVVHIWRNKEQVAKSFIKAHQNISRILPQSKKLANWHSTRMIRYWPGLHPLAGSGSIFPAIDANSVIDSYRKYWDYYMKRAAELENVYLMNIEELNTRKGLDRLFDYLEIPEEARCYKKFRIR